MNRRCFLAGVMSVLVLTLGCRTPNRGPAVDHKVSNRTESTTILIPGLESRLKLMQITDAHISLSVDRETNMMKYAERMHKPYTAPRRHLSQDTSKTTFEYLDDVLQKAKKEQVELLLLTGDIVNFPSAASVEFVLNRLKQTGIPWLYIAGNHDWHYEGLEGSPDLLRQIWTEQSLLPLYQGRKPLCYSAVIKGINFVGIDNSTRKVPQGKPNPLMMRMALNYLEAHSEETVMVGDRMDTDVVAGLTSGMDTILVFSGVTQPGEIARFPYLPTHTFDSVMDIEP